MLLCTRLIVALASVVSIFFTTSIVHQTFFPTISDTDSSFQLFETFNSDQSFYPDQTFDSDQIFHLNQTFQPLPVLYHESVNLLPRTTSNPVQEPTFILPAIKEDNAAVVNFCLTIISIFFLLCTTIVLCITPDLRHHVTLGYDNLDQVLAVMEEVSTAINLQEVRLSPMTQESNMEISKPKTAVTVIADIPADVAAIVDVPIQVPISPDEILGHGTLDDSQWAPNGRRGRGRRLGLDLDIGSAAVPTNVPAVVAADIPTDVPAHGPAKGPADVPAEDPTSLAAIVDVPLQVPITPDEILGHGTLDDSQWAPNGRRGHGHGIDPDTASPITKAKRPPKEKLPKSQSARQAPEESAQNTNSGVKVKVTSTEGFSKSPVAPKALAASVQTTNSVAKVKFPATKHLSNSQTLPQVSGEISAKTNPVPKVNLPPTKDLSNSQPATPNLAENVDNTNLIAKMKILSVNDLSERFAVQTVHPVAQTELPPPQSSAGPTQNNVGVVIQTPQPAPDLMASRFAPQSPAAPVQSITPIADQKHQPTPDLMSSRFAPQSPATPIQSTTPVTYQKPQPKLTLSDSRWATDSAQPSTATKTTRGSGGGGGGRGGRDGGRGAGRGRG